MCLYHSTPIYANVWANVKSNYPFTLRSLWSINCSTFELSPVTTANIGAYIFMHCIVLTRLLYLSNSDMEIIIYLYRYRL